MKVAAQRRCAYAGCGLWFADPHGGTQPRRYCSAECYRASKPAKAPKPPRAPLRATGVGERPKRPVSVASGAQRAKRGACIVTGATEGVELSHVWPRSLGGCDDPLCVVPLRADIHAAYDRHEFDLLPHLLAHGFVDELAHALAHARGDLLGLAGMVTGRRWVPVERREDAA